MGHRSGRGFWGGLSRLRTWFKFALGQFVLLSCTIFHDLLGFTHLVLHKEVHERTRYVGGGEASIKQTLNAVLVIGIAGCFEDGFHLLKSFVHTGGFEFLL